MSSFPYKRLSDSEMRNLVPDPTKFDDDDPFKAEVVEVATKEEVDAARQLICDLASKGDKAFRMSIPAKSCDSDNLLLRIMDSHEALRNEGEDLLQLVCELIEADYLRGVNVPVDILEWAATTVEKGSSRGTITEMTYRIMKAQSRKEDST